MRKSSLLLTLKVIACIKIWCADQRTNIIVVTEVRKRTRFYPVQWMRQKLDSAP